MRHVLAALAALTALTACMQGPQTSTETGKVEADLNPQFSLTSPDFGIGSPIPPQFTCDGVDVNPELTIKDPPHGTKSFALTLTDPDAPSKTWMHWIVWNIPSDTRTIPPGSLPPESVEGVNDFRRTNYEGPCPPEGIHRYVFTLYALDDTLSIRSKSGYDELMREINQHILASSTLEGTYSA